MNIRFAIFYVFGTFRYVHHWWPLTHSKDNQALPDAIARKPSITDHVICSDDVTFHISGSVNRHNCRIWSQGHPMKSLNASVTLPNLTFSAACCTTTMGPSILQKLLVMLIFTVTC